ncbi:hypothetical protein LCGC14_2598230 [marine sediment metagenome]|uniref:Uncharacterized protein n=1 Tax=marine sediment metagenome TaxID=412755 RepID=A0A0F9AXF5_9ZZZZ
MGTSKSKLPGVDKIVGKRGSKNNKRRLEAFGKSGPAHGADWATADAELMRDVVVAITALGGAVLFGMSRDQGAHALTIMLGKEREALWYNADANLNEELAKVRERLLAIT